MTPAAAPPPSRPSRYATLLKLASGGMASVWVGTVRGGLGFRQLVAIKKPHPHLVETAEHRAELLAEAALASSIHHANVVDVRDVEVVGDEVSLVMDYVEGASLSEILGRLQSKGGRLPPGCALRICLDALAGLHAAHELHDDRGRPVGLVHRDVSPQNVLVGTDGIARVVDFGVAKFRKKDHSTTTGQLKGKIAYMSPEYLRNEAIDRRLDVFAMGRRLFRGAHDADTLQNVLGLKPGKVAELVPEAAAIDAVLEGALAKDPSQRFASAAAMSAALESAARSAGIVGSPRDVSAVVLGLFGDELTQRRETIREKLVNEPSVASLFEGARLTPVRAPVLVGPASVSPPTVRDPVDLGTTLRDDAPASATRRDAAPVPVAAEVAVAASQPSLGGASELSLSALDRASIPRPRGPGFFGLVLGLPLVGIVVAVAVFVATRRPTASIEPSPSAVTAPSTPTASGGPASTVASAASSSGPLPASSASSAPPPRSSIARPPAPPAPAAPTARASATGKPAKGPPPNPYAH
jgi:serine/threonine-protein kinase